MTSDAEASDSAVARAAANGDDQAFAILVRRHQEGLYRLLRRYTGNSDEAYEAAHEAFIAAWKSLKRYDPERPFGAWLRTIAINKARDRGRRMRVRRMFFGEASIDHAQELQVVDPSPGAEALLLEQEQTARLDHAISRLPARLKEALLLTTLEGFSQREAGEMLRVSTKTIETRVYRAKKLLAKELDLDMRPSARPR